MAISFNSQQLSGQSSGKRILSALVVLVALVVGATGGYFGNAKVQAMRTAQLNETGRNYVANVLSGDLDKAYAMSSKSLQANQTEEDFKNTLKDLKSTDAKLSDEQLYTSGKIATYSVVAENLPKNPDGATSGVFYVSLVDESGWKVKSVDVQ
jgi:hypothetical protein